MDDEKELEHLREQINNIFEENKRDRKLTEEDLAAIRSRLDRLEVQSDNRDQAINELKEAVKALEEKIQGKLECISAQLSGLERAPAERISQRWEGVIGEVLKYIAIGAIAFFAIKIGVKQ
jgi:hypothetical protein